MRVFIYNKTRIHLPLLTQIIALKMLLISLLVSSCLVQRPLPGVALLDNTSAESDTLTYEVIVFDPGFEGWYLLHSKPLQYHSQTWLESRNRQYVTEWNARVTGGNQSGFFESYIDYRPDLDYGLEVNHRLFYYFQYVEIKLGIPIIPALRPAKFIR